jgi:hypothetical protein
MGSIGVIIKEKQTKFTSVQYLEKVDKIEWSNILSFTLTWELSEVWVDFKQNWELLYQTLETTNDWYYLLYWYDDITEPRAYFIRKNWEKVYATSKYLTFWEDLKLTSFWSENSETWVEINTETSRKKITDKFMQLWKSVNRKIQKWYILWISDGVYGYINKDAKDYISKTTKWLLVNLVLWQISISWQIDSVPEFKSSWNTVQNDISKWTHIYYDVDKQYIKWYLAASAIIKNTTSAWILDVNRVVKRINDYHRIRNAYCINYRSWKMSLDFYKKSWYEKTCWSLLELLLIDLNINIVLRKARLPKYSQEDYVPDWKDKKSNLASVIPEIYNYFYINKSKWGLAWHHLG